MDQMTDIIMSDTLSPRRSERGLSEARWRSNPESGQQLTESFRAERKPQKLLLFCNGARYFKGKSVIINTKQYRDFGDFLSDMTNRLPQTLPLAHGVRQVFTPVTGTRVRQLSQLLDGESYVCAGFETFKPLGYNTQMEYSFASVQNTGRKRTKSIQENLDSGNPTSVRTNSLLRPPIDRYSNTTGISDPGSVGKSLQRRNDRAAAAAPTVTGATRTIGKIKPRIITIYRNSLKPAHNIKILFNRQSVQSYDQLLSDLAEVFETELPGNPITKLRRLDGMVVRGISELFRDADIFIGFGKEETNLKSVSEIFNHLCDDSDQASLLLKKWEEVVGDGRRSMVSDAPDTWRSKHGVSTGNGLTTRDLASKSNQRRGPKAPRKFLERRAEAIEKMNKRTVLPAIKTRDEDDIGEVDERGQNEDDEVEQSYFAKRKTELNRSDSNHSSVLNASVMTRQKDEVRGQDDLMSPRRVTIDNDGDSKETMDFKSASNSLNRNELMARGNSSKNLDDRVLSPSAPLRDESFYAAGLALSESIFKGHVQSKSLGRHSRNEKLEARRRPSVFSKGREDSFISDDEHEAKSHGEQRPGSSKSIRSETKDNLPSGVFHPEEKAELFEEASLPLERLDTKGIPEDRNNNREPVVIDLPHISNYADLEKKYEFGKILGDGNFAVVKSCREKSTRKEFAMKIIDRAKLHGKENLIANEILIMKACNHPNIVKLFHDYETTGEIFLLMELVGGGDLFDFITLHAPFSEVEAAGMIYDLAKALFYLHCRNIVHRDVKPENIVVQSGGSGDSLSLKLADFGLATEVQGKLFTVCGTPTYVAPEILAEIGYGLEIDMWATGVILYILMCGFAPFRGEDPEQLDLFEAIKSGHFEFISPYWDNTSDGVRDLITDLLQTDVRRRLTAVDVICHPFIITCAGSFSPPNIQQMRKTLRSELSREAAANKDSFADVLVKFR